MLRNGFAALATCMLSVLTAAPVAAADIPVRKPISEPQLIANPPRFFLHVGPAALDLDESAKIYAAGNQVPGGTIKIKSHLTFAVEAGYFVTPNIAVSFTGGLPPNVKIEAAGTMQGMGRVGATTYGPMTATIHYHFTEFGRFQPYIGAGPAFMYVFDEKDGIMNTLRVEHTAGFAFQAGANYMFTDRWGMFVDVKKAILRTEASGSLGGAPIAADIKLDPLVVHSGVTFRF
jgi:outer membrane protein